MGVVYRAIDRATRGLAAVKAIRGGVGDLGPRFVREAETLAALRHPGIVAHLAHGRVDDELYLAMEWLDGEDLATRLALSEVSLEDAVAIATQVAGAHPRGRRQRRHRRALRAGRRAHARAPRRRRQPLPVRGGAAPGRADGCASSRCRARTTSSSRTSRPGRGWSRSCGGSWHRRGLRSPASSRRCRADRPRARGRPPSACRGCGWP